MIELICNGWGKIHNTPHSLEMVHLDGGDTTLRNSFSYKIHNKMGKSQNIIGRVQATSQFLTPSNFWENCGRCPLFHADNY